MKGFHVVFCVGIVAMAATTIAAFTGGRSPPGDEPECVQAPPPGNVFTEGTEEFIAFDGRLWQCGFAPHVGRRLCLNLWKCPEYPPPRKP